MPNPLNSILLVGTAYNDQTQSILNVWGGRGGSFEITNQPVFYTLQFAGPGGEQGLFQFGDELKGNPGLGSFEPGVTGVRFRNAGAQAATVQANILPKAHKGLSYTSSSSVGSVLVTGIVNANGTIAGGSGFTVNRTGAGVYVISFTVPFLAQPTILAQSFGVNNFWEPSSISGSGVTLTMRNSGGTPTDTNFDFVAQATV